MRILIVEDEIKLGKALKTILESEGYDVEIQFDGKSGYERASSVYYDLLLLDLNLPLMDGVTVCSKLRQDGKDIPVIMITARDATSDRVLGLDAGADDYLVKPFETQELLARIRALLRRQVKAVTVIEIQDLAIDTQSAIVKRGKVEVNLSATEYSLLKFLSENAERVVPRAEVAQAVWGGKAKSDKLVDVYVGYVRHKIDRDFPDKPPLLHTIKGRGYRLGLMEA